MGLPIAWLGWSALAAIAAGSNGLAMTMLPNALRETGVLMLSVGLLTGCAGLVAAWLVTHYEFPLRRLFDWALVLPLAVPTYLAAYCYVEFLGFPGPVQTALRMVNGAATLQDYWFPDIRSTGGAVLVLSSVLYPYVYVACRGFFLMQSASLNIAARTLGAGGMRTFFTVTLPLSRPALVVGVTLAMMEVVNDLGAVQYFGINAITAGHKDRSLINLASNEYFKAVKTDALEARVITPVFKEIKAGQAKVLGMFAKRVRGAMARFMIENRLEDPQGLKQFTTDGYVYREDLSSEVEWVFTRDHG